MLFSRWFKGMVFLAACLCCYSSALGDGIDIPTRSNSGYGIDAPPPPAPNISTYTALSSLSDLKDPTGAGFFVQDQAPPIGFNRQVLCPISSGCGPGGQSYGWVLETTMPLAPGSLITVNLGSAFTFFDPSVGDVPALMTCDPVNVVTNIFCMQPSTVPTSQCLSEFSESARFNAPGSLEASIFTIGLPTNAACIPSTLVFTSDEFVPPSDTPTFGTVTVSTPEPSTLLLAIAGMAGLPLVRRRRFSSHS